MRLFHFPCNSYIDSNRVNMYFSTDLLTCKMILDPYPFGYELKRCTVSFIVLKKASYNLSEYSDHIYADAKDRCKTVRVLNNLRYNHFFREMLRNIRGHSYACKGRTSGGDVGASRP